jgi:hypothetical protein
VRTFTPHLRKRRAQFQSKPCLHELQTAVSSNKTLIVMHESDPNSGGAPLDQFRAECPEELRKAVFDCTVIPWLRSPHFQTVTLTDIVEVIHRTVSPPRASEPSSAPSSPRLCEGEGSREREAPRRSTAQTDSARYICRTQNCRTDQAANVSIPFTSGLPTLWFRRKRAPPIGKRLVRHKLARRQRV